ncbi:flagellar biosynthesis protein FlhF [Clostridiaceae bacterium HSG29]|nr:flagellar biosynthesis protein FlhF [Clostridiaceae bacterium HSG29]
MKIRRFIGRDMNEAIIKVKSELGIDAVILNSRKIKQPGFLGFFKKNVVEVVAAIDEDYKIETKYSKKSKIKTKLEPEKIEKSVATEPKKNTEMDNKIDKLTMLVENLEKKISSIENHDISEKPISNEKIESNFDKYIKLLTDNDLSEKVSTQIMNQVNKRISVDSNNEKTVLNAMKIVIKDYLGEPDEILSDYNEQKVFMFVGPTGVGKTTTLAKLAAKLSLRENKKVGLITADTYRIAAVEQLKTYSEILGIPLSVIYETDEMDDAINDFKDKDFILVDTAGRNYKDKILKEELEGMLKYIDDPEVYLVLSLVADYKNLINVIKSYDFIKNCKLIFTKYDEAVTFGNILNIKMFANKKLSYITNGQSVPDDIELLNIDALADIIVGDK